MWLVIGGGIVTLLAAAMRQQKAERCSGYQVAIHSDFVSEKDVVKMITAKTGGKIKGVSKSMFDLMELEKVLETAVWVKDAELYFDNKNTLQVTVKGRQPVARVFTKNGKSWYIDEEEAQMPLLSSASADVPVFTGFPVAKPVSKRDKELLHSVRELAAFITRDSFWRSQVAQVDITPEREFEVHPVLGNHVVKLGKDGELEAKFRRLYIFYKEVLSKTGFDKYQAIDVRYRGQVVAQKESSSKVDSVQLRRSVERLMQLSRQAQQYGELNVAPSAEEAEKVNLVRERQPLPGIKENHPAVAPSTADHVSNPNPVKPVLNDKREESGSAGEREPKAVMPKRE